jgi:hypothetical protein
MQVRLCRDSCSDTLRWAERSLCDLVLATSDISPAFRGYKTL